MKLNEVIRSLGKDKSVSIAKQIAHDLNIQWTDGVGVVFNTIVNDSERAPINIGSNSDGPNEVIKKWLLKYQAGKDGKASQRQSNLPGTISDPIIERIIESRISKISENDLNRITYAHRLSMSAENILGLILEEYLADNLETFGWHCAWGETVKSVDFVHKDGRLLQVKNRSNYANRAQGKYLSR